MSDLRRLRQEAASLQGLQAAVSVALGLEALENLLIRKGILVENELRDEMTALVKAKEEQISALGAVADDSPRIITPV